MAGMETIVSSLQSKTMVLSVRIVSACMLQLTNTCLGLQNAEVLSLTYGSIVRQLITDHEDIEEVNKQLDRM